MMQRTCSLLLNNKTVFQRNFSLATLTTASTAARTPIFRNHQCQLLQQPKHLAITKCEFSSTQKRFVSVAQELQEALEKEINAELEVEEDNLGGKTPPSIPGFKVIKDKAEFQLTKTHGNEKIAVLVNINHSVEIDEETEDETIDDDASNRNQQQDMEHDPVPVSLPPFRVEITKGDQRLVFYLQMVKSEEGGYDYSVEEFMIAPTVNSADNKFEEVPEDVYSSSGKYIDQSLHELLFLRYLEERGFTAQFCHDLVKFATHYEHRQYVGLLEKLKKFVGEK